ncbi:ankyrin repeat domain-containing protein [Wolbachia endosymbiont of Anopheles demeilloni]|uniref:ankyrin repeat domain-containing protein n=1 Tax=Wolbachia endosymbiont of Anopheles demeilloni TaxID=2748871 RepID=UPI001F2E86A9|nr:ankyrin repeat domain-containing protein [Wolbachia endosymbiont of Anopheles demeilloni]UIP92743.1 ankyrin repeat domain-containing protein [Wolbachia endosymbiont of Anopheles demeilloni]
MKYERLLKILRTISNLNENNIIERVKEELEKEDPDTYKKWQDNGFNINYTFDDQNTLLHIAARNDLVKIAELLIKKGGNVNTADQDGFTPLHCATINGHEEIVELLLEKRANVDVACEYGRTSLCWAIRNGYSEIARILLENKADPLLGHKSF